MLLFQATYDAIIGTLVEERSLTIQDLYQKIKDSIWISLPNFYKIISWLVSDQILIKEDGKLSIHKRWILGISSLSEKLNSVNKDDKIGEILKIKDGQSLEYFGGSILEIDGLWWNLMIILNNYYGKDIDTFVYQAHPYYMLGTKETELGFFEQEVRLSTIYFLTGNTFFLDIYWVQFYENIGVQIKATDIVPFPREGYCITVIWDYIFEFIYPEYITEYFKLLFETTESLEMYNSELFRKIFDIRTRCKLAVRRNKKYAEVIRKKFKESFS